MAACFSREWPLFSLLMPTGHSFPVCKNLTQCHRMMNKPKPRTVLTQTSSVCKIYIQELDSLFLTKHPSLVIRNSFSKCFLYLALTIDSSCPAIRTICEEFSVNIVPREACFTFQLLHLYSQQTWYAGKMVETRLGLPRGQFIRNTLSDVTVLEVTTPLWHTLKMTVYHSA